MKNALHNKWGKNIFSFLFGVVLTFFGFNALAQVQVDHNLQMTGTTNINRQVKNIGLPSDTADAVSAQIIQQSSVTYSPAGGSANAVTVTLSPAPVAYVPGFTVSFKALTTNTGATTLSANGLAAITIKKAVSTDLAAGDILSGQLVSVMFDGVNFQMLSPVNSSSSGGCSGAPATPGTIAGQTVPCANQTSVIYAISAVSGATSYSWTAPSGDVITAGQGTTLVLVNIGSLSPGNISVTASNSCGSSAASTLAITVSSTTPTPGSITGPNLICNNSSSNYSIASIPDASSYLWTGPSGSSVQGTNPVTINFGANTVGNVCVYAGNGCGNNSTCISLATSETFAPGSAQTFTIPANFCASNVNVTAYGAQGGSACSSIGGLGVQCVATSIPVSAGQVINVIVGGHGALGGSANWGGGGGGGSFVWVSNTNTLLVAAGGGGGSGCANSNSSVAGSAASASVTPTSPNPSGGAGGSGGNGGGGGAVNTNTNWSGGGGGGGFSGNGGDAVTGGTQPGLGGKSALNGGAGGTANGGTTSGGFGGGGGSDIFVGGGGGGYNGGGGSFASPGGTAANGGGGGSSYIINTAGSATINAGVQSGDGSVTITW